jgi:hypothetical protein
MGRLHWVVLHWATADNGAKMTEAATRVAQVVKNFIKVVFAVIPFRVRI